MCSVLAQTMPGDVPCVPSMALCSRRSCWKGPLQTGMTKPLDPVVGWEQSWGCRRSLVLDCTDLTGLELQLLWG